MAKPIDNAAREERLAAKLRENLHRRKAQARGLDAAQGPDPAQYGAISESDLAENDSGALSKQSPES